MRPAGFGGLDHLIVEILERGSDGLAEVVGDIDLVLTGQRADIDLGGGGIRDHIRLGPPMEHIGADGEMGAGVDPSRQTEVVECQQVDRLGDPVRIEQGPGELVGRAPCLDEGPPLRGDRHRRRRRRQPGEGIGERDQGVGAAIGLAAVSGDTSRPEPAPLRPLLGHGDRDTGPEAARERSGVAISVSRYSVWTKSQCSSTR